MDPEIAAAIAALVDIARSVGQSPVLIGALASAAAPGRPASLPTPRLTLDADFAVQVPDWNGYKSLLSALVAKGHKIDPRIEHRVTLSGVKTDILPFGRGVAPDGRSLVWPVSGFTMDVTGLEEAAGSAKEIEVASGVHVRCLTLPGFTLLKTAAFLDRQRKGDIKHKSDAEDLHYWFRHYAYASDADDDRRFFLDGLQEADIDYAAAGAAVLGVEVRRLASPAAANRVRDFLAAASVEYGPFLLATVGQTYDGDEERRSPWSVKMRIPPPQDVRECIMHGALHAGVPKQLAGPRVQADQPVLVLVRDDEVPHEDRGRRVAQERIGLPGGPGHRGRGLLGIEGEHHAVDQQPSLGEDERRDAALEPFLPVDAFRGMRERTDRGRSRRSLMAL